MTGMTKDYAIAILRRMQEPEPYEPQINESAFDALEMAIEAIQKYSTWSQTYSNMVEDVISRKATLDAIHRYFGKRIEQSPMHKTEDGEVYDLGICNPLLEDNKALSQAIKDLPSVQPTCSKMEQVDLIDRQAAIDALAMADAKKGWKSLRLSEIQKLLLELPSAQPSLDEWCTDCKEYDAERHCCPRWNRVIRETLKDVRTERKKMSNKEWVDFLSEQFTVSRTSAREMLHGLMRWKAEDNFKKQFSGGRNEKE